MSLVDYKRISLGAFNGVHDRGDSDGVPLDHLSDALNLRFKSSGACYTREGSSKNLYLPHRVRRFFIFKHKRSTEIDKVPVSIDFNGNLYADNNPNPFFADSNITDFTAQTIFNKCFINPFYSGVSGIISGNNPSWLDPGGVGGLFNGPPVQLFDNVFFSALSNPSSRSIGALPPGISEGNMAAATGAAGSVTAGTHKIAVCYQTISGFITYPGPISYTPYAVPGYVSYVAPGAAVISLTNVPRRVPTSGNGNLISRRFILMTKANQAEYYFVPDAAISPTILNDTTTSFTVDISDTGLVSSADYLFNNRIQQPCAVGAKFYKGRLCLWSGQNDIKSIYDTDALQSGSTLLVSKNGDPETFDNTDGFVVFNPDDGYFITTCFVLRDTYYACKQVGVYATQDNGQEPANWDTTTIDPTIQIPLRGVASFLGTQESVSDGVIVADRSGILLFNGLFQRPELTWKVENIWRRINKDDTIWNSATSLVINPEAHEIYCTLALDGATVPNFVLYGDYSNGLESKLIKWDLWKFPNSISHIDVNDFGGLPALNYSDTVNDYVYKMDSAVTSDDGSIISSYFKTSHTYLRRSRSSTFEGMLHFFNALKSRIKGSGQLILTLYSLDDKEIKIRIRWDLLNGIDPNREYFRWINLVSEKMAVKGELINLDEYFELRRLDIYCNPQFDSRPSGET